MIASLRLPLQRSFAAVFISAAIAACAKAQRQPDTAEVRVFVQGFYDWYVPRMAHDGVASEIWSHDPPYLTQSLIDALRADSAARFVKPHATREVLNFDPYLNSQDPCSRYRVGKIEPQGDSAIVSVHSVCSFMGPDSVSPRPVAVVSVVRNRSRWEMADFRYGKTALGNLLCEYAMADDIASRRPKTCPARTP